jgi:hypothetical protein
MTSFLKCNIWSVNDLTIDPNGFTFIKRVYPYDSDTEEFNTSIPPGFIQIPEFEIKNLHLLNGLDFNFINEFKIAIIRRDKDGSWLIDLKYYEDTYIQHFGNQPINRE